MAQNSSGPNAMGDAMTDDGHVDAGMPTAVVDQNAVEPEEHQPQPHPPSNNPPPQAQPQPHPHPPVEAKRSNLAAHSRSGAGPPSKQGHSILSNFDRAMNLVKTSDVECDIKGCTEEIHTWCLTCKQRLCCRHCEEIHLAWGMKRHNQIPNSAVKSARDLYVQMDLADRKRDNKIPCAIIRDNADAYFIQSEVQAVHQLIYKSIVKFGEDYTMNFNKFIDELAKFMTNERLAIDDVADDEEIQKLATDNILFDNADVLRFQGLNCCERCILDISLSLKRRRETGNTIGIWEKHIGDVKAHMGATFSSYFTFARWLFLLNIFVAFIFFLFLILPNIADDGSGEKYGALTVNTTESFDSIGFLIGHGMETTFMFYGDYSETYDTAVSDEYLVQPTYVLVCGCMLVISVFLAVMHMTGGANFQESYNELSISASIFGAYDHSLVAEQSRINLHRSAIKTSIETAFYSKLQKIAGDVATEEEDLHAMITRHAGFVFGFAVMCLSLVGLWFLVRWEQETLIPDRSNNSVYLVVPACIYGIKWVTNRVYRWVADFGDNLDPAAVFSQTFVLVFLTRMFFTIFINLSAISNNDPSGAPASSVDERGYSWCSETEIGIVFYRVLLADFVLSIFGSTVASFLKVKIFRPCLYAMIPSCSPVIDEASLEKDDGNDDDDIKNGDIQLDDLSAIQATAAVDMDHHDIIREHDKTVRAVDIKDLYKGDFALHILIVDLLYRQALIFSGAPYAPFITIVGLLFSGIHFFAKKYEILNFIRHSRVDISIYKQKQYFAVALIITMVCCIVPFTIFLRRTVYCGPFAGEQIVENFLSHVEGLPGWVSVPINYMTSPVLCWLVLCGAGIYLAAMRKHNSAMATDIEVIKERMRREKLERKRLVDIYGLGADKKALMTGKQRLLDFIDALQADIGKEEANQLYKGLDDAGFADAIVLCKLDKDQLDALIRNTCTPEHGKVVKTRLDFLRRELIYQGIGNKTR